ncbi:MAG: magnesium transporter, partial [Actinomycetota bacterium]
FWDLVTVSVLGGTGASAILLLLTVTLARLSFRRGWDLDAVSTPMVTAAGDMVTLPSLFVATFLVGIRWVTPAVAGVAVILTLYVVVRSLLTDLPLARRILRESIPVLILAGAVDVVAGVVVESRLDRFLIFPVFLVLIPPFLESAGALGGILSSRLASKLHLGVLSPRGRPEGPAYLDATIILLFAVVTFFLTGLAADVAGALVGLDSPGALTVIGVSMLAGSMATVLAVLVAYYAAVATFRLGLDPDNYGIPMITSSMDFVGVIALVIALLAFGVGS